MAFLNTIREKLLRLNRKADDLQEAITFSQAGIHDGATEKQTMTCSENQGRNLVVVTQSNNFPDDMVDYALEMAKRMDYDIIAVNAANITHDVTEFFSSTHEELYKDFQATATENAKYFREKAQAQGLKFAHRSSDTDIDHAVATLTKECGQVEFVITENRDRPRVQNRTENTQRIAQRLSVYSVN